MTNQDSKKQIEDLLMLTAQNAASDLHLSPGHYPTIRVDGRLIPLANTNILDTEHLNSMLLDFLSDEQKNRFNVEKDIDFSYEIDKKVRCRVNVYQTRSGLAATFRLITEHIRTIEELNLPQSLKAFSKLSQGFVLVVGPNGHGKTTTMAALIDLINHERAEKIVTIEDPIEYIYTPDKSIIDQRELGNDMISFNRAIRATFRENVNVILVGEMRDYETMSAAVTAAETGHLVFASLHTNNASQTIERIVDSFPASQQPQIISQLSNTVSGIISQRLIPRIKGGMIPAVEVLVADTGVRTIIRDKKFQQLNLAIETGAEAGMMSMSKYLAKLVLDKEISIEQAEFYSLNINELRNAIGER